MAITKIFAKDKSGKTASLDLSEALKANASFKIVTEIPDPPEANVIYVQVKNLDSSSVQTIQQLFLSDSEGEEAMADLENQTLFIPDATDTGKGVISKNEITALIKDTAPTAIPDATQSEKGVLTLTTVETTANNAVKELFGVTEYNGEVFE